MHTYKMLINTHKFLNTLLEMLIHTATNTLPPLLGLQIPMFHKPPRFVSKGRCFVSTYAAPHNPRAHKSERKHPWAHTGCHHFPQVLHTRLLMTGHRLQGDWRHQQTRLSNVNCLFACFMRISLIFGEGRWILWFS